MCKILVGTSGWVYESWRGLFYPEELRQARELEYYAQYFPTVEINNSFYRLPSGENFSRWAEQVPQNFLFAVKASRYLTHIKKLKDPADPLHNVYSAAKHLEQKLGPILVQLPPRWRKNTERLREFCELARAIEGVDWVVEFRDESWHDPTVYDLLQKFNIALCIADSNKLKRHDVVTANFTYIRYHGRTPLAAPYYTSAQLKSEATKIRKFAQNLDGVYVYFNNDALGHAIDNARRLQGFL